MSWKHDYDDFFEGIRIDDRDLHYHTDELMPSIQVKVFVKSQEREKEVSLDFYVYKDERNQYSQKQESNVAIQKLFQSETLLITPISVLEQVILEEQKLKAEIAAKEIQQQEVEEEEDLSKKINQFKDKQLWVDKYMPKRYDELLSYDKTNREVLCWLKAWDPIVFKKKINKKKLTTTSTPYFGNYGKNMFGQTSQQTAGFNKVFRGNQQKEGEQAGNKTGAQNEGQFVQKPFFFDLEDEYSLNKMQNNVILLAGPPGSGKTTLARTVAAHCGYRAIEINASEDRTAVKLIDRIETLTKNEALQFKAQDSQQVDKPSLIIIDEVDGALESESHGAVNLLLDFIFKGEKPSSSNNKEKKQKQVPNKKKEEQKKEKKDEDDEDEVEEKQDDEIEEGAKNNQGNQSVHIRRPVIFICNDVYSKGLRELRKKALVFNFAKARSEKLLARLKEICQKEKVYLDSSGLTKICDHNENDIRSAILNLQMISKLQKQNNKSKISIDQILMEEKNNSKGVLELLENIFMVSSQRNSEQIDILRYSLHVLMKNTQPDVLIDTTLINYLKLKSAERHFERIPNFLKDLAFSEVIESNLLKHNYELTKFIAIPLINFGLLLKSSERTKLEYPRNNFFIKRREKAAIDCVELMLENIPKSSAPFMSKKTFVVEILSNLYQMIQPNILASSKSEAERRSLFSSISIMIDFSLKLLDRPFKIDRNGGKFTIFFNPQVERMLLFGETTPEQTRLTERSIHFIQTNYELVAHQKQLTRELSEDDALQKKLEQKLINIQMDDKYNKQSAKRKQRIEGEDATFLYKYRDGVSIPIKYDVPMEHFLS